MVDFNTNFNPTLNKNFSGRQQQLRNTDFNKDFSAALRGQQPPAPRLNMGNLSSLPNQMPNQMPAPGQTQNISPYEVEQKDIVRSPQEEQALEDSFRIEAQRYANTREREERSDYGQDRGLLGAIYSGIVNKMRRGEKLTRYEEEEYNRLSANQQVADSNAVRGYQSRTATTNRNKFGAPQLVQRMGADGIMEYQNIQYGSDGSILQLEIDNGWSVVPTSAAMNFDTNYIAQQAGAKTAASVDQITAETEPKALQAYEIQQAQLNATHEARLSELSDNFVGLEADREAALTVARETAITEAELLRQEKLYTQTQRQELEAGAAASWSLLGSQDLQMTKINELAAEAKDMAKGWTTGFAGQVLRFVGGTAANDLQFKLSTLRAYAGFDSLEAMRKASEDGSSGLGQLTREEMELLQNAWIALDTSQSAGQLRDNIDRYVKQVEESWARVREQYEVEYGDYEGGVPNFRDPLPSLSESIDEGLAFDFSGGLTNAADESTASRFPQATARTVEQIVRGN